MMTSMTTTEHRFWRGIAASVPGFGHIRCGIPCQDASFVQTSPRASLIVCDGRGSAKLSHFGAQGAVTAFRRQCTIMEPFLGGILDRGVRAEEQWVKFCRIMYRTLMQVKLDLAEERGESEREFDCTVVFAIAGQKHIGCFQVGDGSLVLRQNVICQTVFLPDKGEFANQTHFLRAGGEERLDFQYALFPTQENSGIAATSDGPEHLMFQLQTMRPGKIFDAFFKDLQNEQIQRQDIMDYLTDRCWLEDPRGADDRSLTLLVPLPVEDEQEQEENAMSSRAPMVSSEMKSDVGPKNKQVTEVKTGNSGCHKSIFSTCGLGDPEIGAADALSTVAASGDRAEETLSSVAEGNGAGQEAWHKVMGNPTHGRWAVPLVFLCAACYSLGSVFWGGYLMGKARENFPEGKPAQSLLEESGRTVTEKQAAPETEPVALVKKASPKAIASDDQAAVDAVRPSVQGASLREKGRTATASVPQRRRTKRSESRSVKKLSVKPETSIKGGK